MSKYKGNYGSSKETLAPPSTAASSSSVDESSTLLSTASTFENFVELLDSYGFDLPAMLLIFWCLVLFVIVCGVNLYLTLVKRQQRINAVANQSEGHDGAKSEPTVTATSVTSQLHSSPKYHSEDDEDSKGWIQRVIEWLYRADINTPAVITECIESWLASLNAKAKKLTVENGIHIEFVHLYRDKSSAIRFSNVKVDSELNDNILTTLKATCDRLVIQVRVAATSRDLSSGQSALYEIELNKFSALLKVVCKPDDSLFVARFLERPETKVHITNGPQSASEKTFSPDLIINGILNILSSTLVDLNFNYAANFPHFRSRSLSSSLDGTLENGNGSRTRSRRAIERKLFVTIVKAHNLTLNQAKEGHEVYCTIELNEPREKRKTASIREDASSPVWQDHFLFGLNEQSREILFEVFDGFQEKKTSSSRSTENNRDECLGFGTVNILELRLNPSEKLSIPLQSNGLHRGSLEIELLLMEHKLPASMCTDDTGELLNTTEKNQFQHSKVPAELASYYRDLSSTNSTSSHLDHYTRSSLNTIKSDDNAHSSEGYGTDRGITPEVAHSSDALPPTRPESRASQPREPRSLIRTIRKRLSFSKRSKSVERQPNSFREPSVGSNDIRDERARSVPGSREPSAPRDMANGKKQESFLSLASNTSFFAENSTLVLECTVNGEKKHYIVPYSKANKRKYRRRKGTKLHVFNDHLFVAQHMASSQVCQVCTKTFPLRLGKQGYACRECGFLTHKQCHINADAFCSANGAARLNFEVDTSDTPKQVPSPVPEVRVIAPTESGGLANDTDNEIRS